MTTTTQNSEEKARRSLFGLLAWLLLVPMVLGLLLCFGQLALIINMQIPAAITRSLLRADYSIWAYDEIAPINLAAFLEDVKREQLRFGMQEPGESVESGVFWIPPTATPGSIAQITATPQLPTPSATSSPTASPSFTPTLRSTATETPLPTLTPAPTKTNTIIPFIPSPTQTERPENPPPPPPPSPPPPQPTITPLPPTATLPPVIPPDDPTDEPLLPTPTYAPVRPIAEDQGVSEPFQGACRAYFGYRNANPQEVQIPIGQPRNYFNPADVVVEPYQPDYFQIGRVVGAFYVVWNSGGPFIWYLEGAEATASWCNP
jgi:hypothetical protein